MACLPVAMLLMLVLPAGHAFAQATAQEQFDLADRYFAGDGVAKDPVAAVAWYRKAAEQGHMDASSFSA